MLNGLIGEADSLLKATLEIMDDNFTRDVKKITDLGEKVETKYNRQLENIGEMLRSILGLLVVVPSNPDHAYFLVLEGILNFLQKDEWGNSPLSYTIKLSVLDSGVRYLASQTQETLPYRIQNVESNDQIFIGSDDFQKECNSLMDHLFEQILETIQKLDEVKDNYYQVLFTTCIDVADLLIGTCVFTKQINGFINKMFKMSDKYLTENNKVASPNNQLTRVRINSSFESFRKKKEQLSLTSAAPEAQ